jgi:hypothetical protein
METAAAGNRNLLFSTAGELLWVCLVPNTRAIEFVEYSLGLTFNETAAEYGETVSSGDLVDNRFRELELGVELSRVRR